MKYYSDGYLRGSNPSVVGGFRVVDENGVLVIHEVIEKENLTNNETELRGIERALEICEPEDTVSTDSMCVLSWVRKGRSKARPELDDIMKKCHGLLKERHINLMWEARDYNLAGIMNDGKNAKDYEGIPAGERKRLRERVTGWKEYKEKIKYIASIVNKQDETTR